MGFAKNVLFFDERSLPYLRYFDPSLYKIKIKKEAAFNTHVCSLAFHAIPKGPENVKKVFFYFKTLNSVSTLVLTKESS